MDSVDCPVEPCWARGLNQTQTRARLTAVNGAGIPWGSHQPGCDQVKSQAWGCGTRVPPTPPSRGCPQGSPVSSPEASVALVRLGGGTGPQPEPQPNLCGSDPLQSRTHLLAVATYPATAPATSTSEAPQRLLISFLRERRVGPFLLIQRLSAPPGTVLRASGQTFRSPGSCPLLPRLLCWVTMTEPPSLPPIPLLLQYLPSPPNPGAESAPPFILWIFWLHKTGGENDSIWSNQVAWSTERMGEVLSLVLKE